MAVTRATPEVVALSPAPIDRYRALLAGESWSTFERQMSEFAAQLHGRTVWNVNSTARGGGVAELLAFLIPYDLGVGIDERWLVIEAGPAFFDLTKKIHTLLHGLAPEGAAITPAERNEYEQTLARNALAVLDAVKPGDVVVLHDPQTAGLVPALTRRGIKVVWRSHIGVDVPNDIVRSTWRFLLPYLRSASAFVFSRQGYIWDGLDASRSHVIAPCIDPFTEKNRDMNHETIARWLHAAGISPGVPADARVIVQVSRWDRLKDPIGVLQSFALHIAPMVDSWLVLAGPEVSSVDDDPEQPEVLRSLRQLRDGMDPAVRDRVVIAELPMRDIAANAAMVNAVQRRADVVVQKSLAEGFGLTVAEAMWKARPVVASRVGGIEDQIEDGRSGILIDDPMDLEVVGSTVVALLADRQRAAELGREARLRIVAHFLAPRHLLQQAHLIESLLD